MEGAKIFTLRPLCDFAALREIPLLRVSSRLAGPLTVIPGQDSSDGQILVRRGQSPQRRGPPDGSFPGESALVARFHERDGSPFV